MKTTEEQKIVRKVQKIIDDACQLGRENKDTPENKLNLDTRIYELLTHIKPVHLGQG